MQARWPWLHTVDSSRPWSKFGIVVPRESLSIARAATRVVVGNGRRALFWEDRWLDGWRIAEVAPLLHSLVPQRIRRTRTVGDALPLHAWARDVGPNLNEATILEYLQLWTRVVTVQLAEDVEDSFVWSWEKDGKFSVRSAYAARFAGREVSTTADFTWRNRAPLRCRFFMWLAMRDRCWTSDRLARRGLPHQDACLFCDQEDESIEHLLLTCVFSRTVWA